LKRRICSNEVLPFERAAVTYPACLHAGGGRIRSRRCRTGSSYPFHCYRARQEAEVVEQGLYRFGHLRRNGDAADAARGAAERERGNRQTDEGPRQAQRLRRALMGQRYQRQSGKFALCGNQHVCARREGQRLPDRRHDHRNRRQPTAELGRVRAGGSRARHFRLAGQRGRPECDGEPGTQASDQRAAG